MKTNQNNIRKNYWKLLADLGLNYGRNVHLDEDHKIDYTGLKFDTARELYEYMTNPNAKSRLN